MEFSPLQTFTLCRGHCPTPHNLHGEFKQKFKEKIFQGEPTAR